MRRILGILVLVLVLYGMILGTDAKARTVRNHQQIAERLAFYGVLTLGAGDGNMGLAVAEREARVHGPRRQVPPRRHQAPRR